MRIIKLLLVFCIVVLFACLCRAQATKNYNPKRFEVAHGINISAWFSQNSDAMSEIEKKFTFADIHFLKEQGFDHVRIPLDDTYLFDENLNEREERWAILMSRVDTCMALGMKVVIDYHKSRVHYPGKTVTVFSDKKSEEYFFEVWKHIQNRFKDYPTNMLAYECLNEPHPAKKSAKLWNVLVNKWIEQIRRTERTRFLYISSAYGNNVETFNNLILPKDDKYLVLTFHYYRPHNMCFYDGKSAIIPKFLYKKAAIVADFSKVMAIAYKYNLQVNCGEFGCRRYIPDNLRYSWFKDMVDTFKSMGISYTLWAFNGSGYGIRDARKKLDTQMLENLNLK